MCLATPADEAVISPGLDAPGPHLFCQTVGWCEDEKVRMAEELHRPRGFTTPAAAV